MKPILNATFLGLLLSIAVSSISPAQAGKAAKGAPDDAKSAEKIGAQERAEILSFVVFTFAASEACKQFHPALSGQLDDALSAWRSRNEKHVERALSDPGFDALKREALAKRPSTPVAEPLCRDTIRSLGVAAETDIEALRPRHRSDRVSGNPQDSIGYPSVNAALAALKRDPTMEVRDEAGWTVISRRAEKNFVMWSFTPAAHAAYPAAVKRTLLEKDGAVSIEMNVLCQADRVPCDKLMDEFRTLNNMMLDHLRNAQQSAPPDARMDGMRQ